MSHLPSSRESLIAGESPGGLLRAAGYCLLSGRSIILDAWMPRPIRQALEITLIFCSDYDFGGDNPGLPEQKRFQKRQGGFVRLPILFIIIFLVSACSVFTPPREKPLLESEFSSKATDKSRFGVLATNANRRVAIMDIVNGHICVEPPPEAANTISEAFSALLEGNVQDKGNLGAELSQSITQNVNQLYRRTQTVQLFRDAVFSLCQTAINGSLKIEDRTLALIPSKDRKRILELLNNRIEAAPDKRKGDIKKEISRIEADGMYSLDTVEVLHGLNGDEGVGEDLKNLLITRLEKEELKSRLHNTLESAFSSLKEELPYFYMAERFRFIAEIGKPVRVCQTEYGESEEGETVIKSQKCRAEIPKNLEKVVASYAKALNIEEDGDDSEAKGSNKEGAGNDDPAKESGEQESGTPRAPG